MKKITLENKLDLYVNKSDKFKTWSASVHIYRPLNVKEASCNALLAKVLKSSTGKYPSRRLLARQLDTLYGTHISTGVRKNADTHTLIFNIKAVCDCYLPEKIAPAVIELLKEIITEPDVIDCAFKPEIVELEKTNLKKQIEAYINDKSSYADRRCVEVLCENNNYATDVNGSLEEIDKITPESLYRHYCEVLENSKIDVFLCGNEDEELVVKSFETLKSNGKVPVSQPIQAISEFKEVTEVMDVTQGKLVMGFTTGYHQNNHRCALMVFNAVFGGSPTSKLFNNVREKLSLAYYANSRISVSKGILFARSGIEISKFEQVREEINTQLEEICSGNVTDEEMENAKSHLVNIYSSLDDDPETTVSLISGWITEGETRSVEEIIEGIKSVGIDEVVEVAKSYRPGAVYFLKGEQKQ